MILSYPQSSLKASVTLSSACPVKLQWLCLDPVNVVASGLQTHVGFGGFGLVVAGNLPKEFKDMYMLQQVLIALRIRCRNSVILIVLAMVLFWSVV